MNTLLNFAVLQWFGVRRLTRTTCAGRYRQTIWLFLVLPLSGWWGDLRFPRRHPLVVAWWREPA